MKPMKLEIFPPCNPHARAQIAWNIENGHSAYWGFHLDMHVPGLTAMRAKRLTDAQLAAESYRQMIRAVRQSGLTDLPDGMHAPTDACIIGAINVETARLQTLVRFATLPHYDEVPE